MPAIIGMAAFALNPELDNRNFSFPYLALDILPPAIGIVVLLAGLYDRENHLCVCAIWPLGGAGVGVEASQHASQLAFPPRCKVLPLQGLTKLRGLFAM